MKEHKEFEQTLNAEIAELKQDALCRLAELGIKKGSIVQYGTGKKYQITAIKFSFNNWDDTGGSVYLHGVQQLASGGFGKHIHPIGRPSSVRVIKSS